MAVATRERIVAVRLLREQRQRAGRARELLRGSDEVGALSERERGFVTRLVLGVVRTAGTLDTVLDAHLRRGGHLEPRVRDALRLSAYELLYLGTPGPVAVSQGVELVRRANKRATGLANAVLRRVAAEDVPRLEQARARVEAGGCNPHDLAFVGGLPHWLVVSLAGSLAEGDLTSLVLSLDSPAPVYVVGNAAKGDAGRAVQLLREAGIGSSPTGLPCSFALKGGGALGRSGLVSSVDLVPADLGAQEVALACRPIPGMRVLEVGEGRGTKSILLENAALAKGGPCEICAVDSEAYKVDVAKRRMAQAGLAEHVHSWVLDGRALGGVVPDDTALPPRELGYGFDLAFVDAPCSGTGTMRRHPEIPWSLEEASVSQGGVLPRLQGDLLAAAAARVRRGGVLAYSTCSLLAEENEAVVKAFLKGDAGASFRVRQVDVPPFGRVTSEGYLRTLSFSPSADGHFCALLERIS